ncbi:hypothetical protein MFLAVUS_007254 [Mucor flavus]|uniref:Galactose oxidase n=1 Tax=Mucor flavus TaxID=439312 RepID=A0ABP9Z3S5_9FUNG
MSSLNLYHSWNTTDPAWSMIEANNSPSAFFASTYLPISNNFFIDGGLQDTKKSQTMYYDTLNNIWVTPNIKGLPLIKRKQHTAVADDKGRVWLWGGVSDISTYGGVTIYYNNWTVIDTQTWTTNFPDIQDNPPPRIDHTATIIANTFVLIIGGVVYSHDVTDPAGKLTLNPVSMSSLLIFDISNSRWINVTAGGNIPAPRRGHSAVLSHDGKSVIIFGGGMPEDDHGQLNDVFILELETMRWTAPSIKGVPPKPRRYHKVEDYLLVAFGLGGDEKGFDDVNILSTSSWSWITQYTANTAWLSGNSTSNGIVRNNTGNTTAYDPNSKKNEGSEHEVSSETRIKAGVIAGVVSGGVVILGGGIFLVLSVVIFRRRQTRNKKSSNSNTVDPASIRQDNDSTLSILEPVTVIQVQKPDNRSSIRYAAQLEDGVFYKPNATE